MGRDLNINDIARLAGVSRSTVSRVLTNNKNVKKETAVRVRKAIQDADYHPNVMARGLATGRMNLVAMLLSETRHPFYLEIIERLDQALRDRGYVLSICYLGSSDGERTANFRAIQKYGYSGYIIGDILNEPGFVRELTTSSQPLVFFNRHIKTLTEYDAVVVDNYHGGQLAGKHLTDLGHRDFAVLTGPLDSSVSRERYRGFADALRESGVPLDPGLVEEGDLTLAAGTNFAARLFAEPARRCSAVFAGNDSMAVGILHYCRKNGIRVPDDVSIVGFDDLSLTGAEVLDLTTVQQPYEALCSLTAERIAARINGEERNGQIAMLEPSLVVRGSTAPV